MLVEIPNVARMYDYYLGGAEATDVDRRAAEQILAQAPQVRVAVQENRRFLERALTHLAAQGITQFLDIGSGLPTQRNVHQLLPPQCKVVYVDYDPYVVERSAELLSTVDNAICRLGDVRDPDEILAGSGLDLDRPVGVLLLAVLNFVSDDDQPEAILARLRQRLVAGSRLALSHGARHDDQLVQTIESSYRRTSGQAFLRTRAQIEHLLQGWQVLAPGVVFAAQWPDHQADAGTRALYAAMAAHT